MRKQQAVFPPSVITWQKPARDTEAVVTDYSSRERQYTESDLELKQQGVARSPRNEIDRQIE